MMKIKSGFIAHNDFNIVSSSLSSAVISRELTETATNPYGYMHGGLAFSLADTAAGLVAAEDGHYYVTMDGNINYLTNVKSGLLVATAVPLHRGNNTCVVEVKITCEDKLLAIARLTMFRIKLEK